jgi:hypothetical protein
VGPKSKSHELGSEPYLGASGILGAGEETSAVGETLEHTRELAGENLTTSTKEQWGNRRLPASPATRATKGRPSTTRGHL